MPLTPPADNSKAVLAVAIGVGLALVLFTVTKSNLPHVGDNIHALPHGGHYRDGTKEVYYGGPKGSLGYSATRNSNVGMVLVILGLVFTIRYLSSGRSVAVSNPCCQRNTCTS